MVLLPTANFALFPTCIHIATLKQLDSRLLISKSSLSRNPSFAVGFDFTALDSC